MAYSLGVEASDVGSEPVEGGGGAVALSVSVQFFFPYLLITTHDGDGTFQNSLFNWNQTMFSKAPTLAYHSLP